MAKYVADMKTLYIDISFDTPHELDQEVEMIWNGEVFRLIRLIRTKIM